MTLVTCQLDPASSPAPHWDTGPLNLLDVYAVKVKTKPYKVLSIIITNQHRASDQFNHNYYYTISIVSNLLERLSLYLRDASFDNLKFPDINQFNQYHCIYCFFFFKFVRAVDTLPFVRPRSLAISVTRA